MTDSSLTLRSAVTPHRLSVNDEMGSSITTAIDQLAGDGSLYTRLRLRGARSREAIKLAETALVESMAAKRRTFVVAVGLAEDHARKLLLDDSMRNTEAIQREIAQTISDALENFERLINTREQAAYASELARIDEARALRDAGRLSERRYEQLEASIQASTDKIIEGVHETTREIFANLRRRFSAALRQGNGLD
ncbi:hypothetical protein [Neomegalonema sp.]|uniref:hypothetical protein n=1 Tax=Neomegalonema sp. TaxID=2039713 RepID=UPI00261416DA|nr:hypothetical protein [Neomegalonema sp.]MDD2867256.1 hypothetical protein [Neomegalonema sp.]